MPVLLHHRTAGAAAHTGAHFNKTMMNTSLLDFPEGCNAVFHPVQRHIGKSRRVLRHSFQDAARGREKAGQAVRIRLFFPPELHPLFFQPAGQLFIGQHRIHSAFIVFCFILLGHAGTDEHSSGLGDAPLDILAVRLHGRKYIRQVWKHPGEIFLNQKIDRMAAGRDHHVAVLFHQNAVVLPFDHGCSQGGFLHVVKAKFFQRFPHGFDPHTLIVRHEGWGQRDYHRISALDQDPGFLGFVHNCLGILGADHKAMAAQNAFVPIIWA